MLPWVVFAGLPLLVAPWFLDYAEEAKSVALLALVAALAAQNAVRAGAKARTGAPRGRLAALLCVTAILSVAGCFWAPQIHVALHAVRNEWLAVAAALLLAPRCEQRTVLWALAWGALAVAVLGLVQVALDIRVLTPAADMGQFPGVTFGNRGLASLFVALGIAPTLALYREASSRRWLLGGAVLVLAAFVLVAMTRAVWIGSVAALSVWVGASGADRRTAGGPPMPLPRPPPSRTAFLLRLALLAAGLLLIGGSMLLVLHNDALRLLLAQRLDPASWTANPRLVLWGTALAHFQAGGPRTVLFGFGPGAFQTLAPSWLAGTALAERLFIDAHNDLLQILLEYGAVGLGLRLVLVAGGLRALWRASARGDGGSAAAAVGLASVVLLVVASLFFYPLHLPFFLMLAAFFLLSAPSTPLVVPAPGRRASPLLRLMAAAVAAAAALLFVQRLAIETQMRTFVKEAQPAFVKTDERRRLAELLDQASAPAVYFRMLEPPRRPVPPTAEPGS